MGDGHETQIESWKPVSSTPTNPALAGRNSNRELKDSCIYLVLAEVFETQIESWKSSNIWIASYCSYLYETQIESWKVFSITLNSLARKLETQIESWKLEGLSEGFLVLIETQIESWK